MIQSEENTFTPTWGGTGVSLGNGSLSGSYARNGDLVTCTIAFEPGSTTNFGSGDWTFTLPFTSAAAAVGSVWMNEYLTAYHAGVCLTAGNLVTCYANNNANLVRSAVPFTWANGDKLFLSVTFRV